MTKIELGKIQSVHVVAPAFVQRAAIVSVLSFLFFLAMMIGVYVRQNIIYFLLATAFLLVNLITMFGWLMLRRKILKVYENGFTYQKFNALWSELEKVEAVRKGAKFLCTITKKTCEKVVLNETLHNVENFARRAENEIAKNRLSE